MSAFRNDRTNRHQGPRTQCQVARRARASGIDFRIIRPSNEIRSRECIPCIVMPFGWVFKGLAATTPVLDLLSQPDRNIGAQGRCAGGARASTLVSRLLLPAMASHAFAGVIFDFRAPHTLRARARHKAGSGARGEYAKKACRWPWSCRLSRPGRSARANRSRCPSVRALCVDRVAQDTVDPIGTPGGSVSASRSVCKLAVKRALPSFTAFPSSLRPSGWSSRSPSLHARAAEQPRRGQLELKRRQQVDQ